MDELRGKKCRGYSENYRKEYQEKKREFEMDLGYEIEPKLVTKKRERTPEVIEKYRKIAEKGKKESGKYLSDNFLYDGLF